MATTNANRKSHNIVVGYINECTERTEGHGNYFYESSATEKIKNMATGKANRTKS